VLYEDQIEDCRSWVYCDKRKRIEMKHGYKDSDGHGTHCVSVILKVAQNAHIYVARVFESRSQRRVEDKMINQAIVKVFISANTRNLLLTIPRHLRALSTNGR
jgi:hypothetical protein